MKFVWIDDNPDRKIESVNLSKSLGVTTKFVDVKKKDLNKTLEVLLKGDKPNLILIDHKFEDVESGIFKTGSTAAAFIRETWPTCPIVCVTGTDKNIVDSQKRSLYETVFEIDHISKHYATIKSIAKGFESIMSVSPKKVEDILALMKVPKDEMAKLVTIFPNEFKENFSDAGLATNISDWVRNILLKRPGFLYDRLAVATLLGIKESSFGKVEKLFIKAKYNGVFADQSDERWWKSEVISTLSKKIQGRGLPWERGRLLEGIKAGDFSKCYATKKDYPETVAFIDQTKNAKRAAMKLVETVPHPNYEEMLFFDEMRMMKAAE